MFRRDKPFCNIFACSKLSGFTGTNFPQFSSVQSLSRVRLFATPWIAACLASLSITNSRSSPKLMSIELVMPSSHLIHCRPLLLLPQSLPASESFPMSQLFAWGGQSTGVSALPSVLLLLLSCFSRIQLCATPETAAHQAPPSLGFSRQEHWSGLPFPSPMHESEKWKGSRSVVSDSYRPHGLQPTRLLHPWDFRSKSTGVGCHCLLRASVLVLFNSDVL